MNTKTGGTRKDSDSLGEVDVAGDKLWGAQTQRSLEHFRIGKDLMPEAGVRFGTSCPEACRFGFLHSWDISTSRNTVKKQYRSLLARSRRELPCPV